MVKNLTTLRISLNREVKHSIESWNLGIGTVAATKTARAIIKERLLSPAPQKVASYLEMVLQQDDLYTSEYTLNREVLQALLKVLLTDADKEAIATAADAEGVFKFLRSGYGCGKTFMSKSKSFISATSALRHSGLLLLV